MCPRLIHKDGSLCHSKTYWASLNKKPPLKEFELPDLFSDNEEMEIQENSAIKGTRNTKDMVCAPNNVMKGNTSEIKDDNTENTTDRSKRDILMTTLTNTITDNVMKISINTKNVASATTTTNTKTSRSDNGNTQLN